MMLFIATLKDPDLATLKLIVWVGVSGIAAIFTVLLGAIAYAILVDTNGAANFLGHPAMMASGLLTVVYLPVVWFGYKLLEINARLLLIVSDADLLCTEQGPKLDLDQVLKPSG